MIDLTTDTRPEKSGIPPRIIASGSSGQNPDKHAYKIDPEALESCRVQRPTATKTVSGVFSYGFRYYVPELGRWASRDPIRERGGVNLYGMTESDPVNSVDYFGLVCDLEVARLKIWPGHEILGGIGNPKPGSRPGRDFTSVSGSWSIMDPQPGRWGSSILPEEYDWESYLYWETEFLQTGKFYGGSMAGKSCKKCASCEGVKSCLEGFTAPGRLDVFEGLGICGNNCRSAIDEVLKSCCLKKSTLLNYTEANPEWAKVLQDLGASTGP